MLEDAEDCSLLKRLSGRSEMGQAGQVGRGQCDGQSCTMSVHCCAMRPCQPQGHMNTHNSSLNVTEAVESRDTSQFIDVHQELAGLEPQVKQQLRDSIFFDTTHGSQCTSPATSSVFGGTLESSPALPSVSDGAKTAKRSQHTGSEYDPESGTNGEKQLMKHGLDAESKRSCLGRNVYVLCAT